MRNLMRVAIAVNLVLAGVFAAEASWVLALGNFVAACCVAVPMDDLFGHSEA